MQKPIFQQQQQEQQQQQQNSVISLTGWVTILIVLRFIKNLTTIVIKNRFKYISKVRYTSLHHITYENETNQCEHVVGAKQLAFFYDIYIVE